MTNRYAPPGSEVADVYSDAQGAERPKSVRIAVGLLVASGLLRTVRGAFFPTLVPAFVSALVPVLPVGVWFTVSFIFAFTFLFAVAFWYRQNWARILFVVLFALGLPGFFLIGDQLQQEGALSVALLIVQICLSLATAVYLFVGTSSNWYRKRARQTSLPLGASADV